MFNPLDLEVICVQRNPHTIISLNIWILSFHWLIYVDILLTNSWLGYIYTPEKLYPIVSPYISPLHHVLWNELHSSMLVKLDKQRLSCCLNHEGFPMLCSFNVRYFRYLNPWWIVPENSACCNQETSVRFLFMTSPFLLVGGPHRFYQTRFAGKSAI